MKSFKFIFLFAFLFSSVLLFSQKRPLDLAILGEPLKNFTLPVYGGGEFNLTDNLGKNTLLVFPRGYYSKDIWCDICTYEYLDIVDEFYDKKLADKYNLDVIFILPYSADTIDIWLKDLPEVYASFEKSKHIDTVNNERAKTWVDFTARHYPKVFDLKEAPHPFKILVDGKHSVSERLEFFKTEWWGTQADQNTPAIILLDSKGTVVFKYIAQHTIDRPTMNYLVNAVDLFLTKFDAAR